MRGVGLVSKQARSKELKMSPPGLPFVSAWMLQELMANPFGFEFPMKPLGTFEHKIFRSTAYPKQFELLIDRRRTGKGLSIRTGIQTTNRAAETTDISEFVEMGQTDCNRLSASH